MSSLTYEDAATVPLLDMLCKIFSLQVVYMFLVIGCRNKGEIGNQRLSMALKQGEADPLGAEVGSMETGQHFTISLSEVTFCITLEQNNVH